MGKFNFKDTIKRIQNSLNDQRRQSQFGLGESLEGVSEDPKDFIVLPDWWRTHYGILGLPFGKWTQISGRSDSGKSSLALVSMKAAQDQGFGVIYVETERKTGTEDLISAGIDPKGVMVIGSNITEEIFDGINRAVDSFFDDYPGEKLLLIIDSYGNSTSMRDSEIDMTEKSGMVGGTAKSNRLGLGAIQARLISHPIATLIVNYSYANIGSVGTTQAGGRALEFLCSLIIEASRKAWYERTMKGVKVRAGAVVVWRTIKNHYAKSLKDEKGEPRLLPKELILRITGEGMHPVTQNTKK